MKVSIGRIIHVTGIESNGASEHPAIITRVWAAPGADTNDGPVTINCTVFPDMALEKHHGSIPLYDTFEEGTKSVNRVFGYWPPRV